MNTHRRRQTIKITSPDGTRTSITRTVAEIRISEIQTLIGVATIQGRSCQVELDEEGRQWRVVERIMTERERRTVQRINALKAELDMAVHSRQEAA